MRPLQSSFCNKVAAQDHAMKIQPKKHMSPPTTPLPSESIPALGWVTVSPAPGPFVLEMNHAGQFYTNRFRGSEEVS